jgi:hypothetical protein
MRRIYFLTGSISSARRITDELLLDRIPESHIHVLSHSGELPDDLPEATIDQSSDFYPGLFKGFGLGAVTGLVVGVLLAFLPWLELGGMALLTTTPFLLGTAVAGGLLGAFAGSIVGVSVPNQLLVRFDKELDAGKILLMVDIERDRADEIRGDIQRLETGAKYCGMEPLKPAFP